MTLPGLLRPQRAFGTLFMFVKRRVTQSVYVMALQRLNEWVKAKLLQP